MPEQGDSEQRAAGPVLSYASAETRTPSFPPGFLRVVLTTATVLLVTELWAATTARDTEGEVVQVFVFMLVLGGNAIALTTVVARCRWLTLILLVVLWAAIVPRQVLLRLRLDALNQEARSIVQYVEGVKTQTGHYPANLNGYRFTRPWARAHMQYSHGFELRWWVIQRGISYWYNPSDGYRYYPD